MSITDYSNLLYERNGRIRHVENWRVYALFCMRDDGVALVKVGISSIIYDRIVQLLPGLMYPLEEVRHLHIGDRKDAATFEATIHRLLKEKNTRGEWFEFDTKSADDKTLFNGAFQRAWAVHMPRGSGLMKWERISAAQIRAHLANRTEERKNRKKRVPADAWSRR